MPDYLKKLGFHYPNKKAKILNDADPSVYANIIWEDGEVPVSSATLDGLPDKIPPLGEISSSLVFCDGSVNYIKKSSASYITICQFIFRGSFYNGIPTNIKIIGYVTATASGSVRLYDVTSSLVIAEKTGIINTTASIINLGTISNIPEEESIVELQIKTTKPFIYVSGLNINY